MLFWADSKTYKRALSEHIDHLVEKGIYGRQVLKRLKVFSREDYIELNKTINPDYVRMTTELTFVQLITS
jgi:hypothetical protein